MVASFEWQNRLDFMVTVPGSQVQFFQFTYPVLPPKSLQRFIARFWVTGSFGRSGSGQQQFPTPGDWSIAYYLTDTTGFLRSYANNGWQEGMTGFADSDVGGWNTVGTPVGPYPVVLDVQARRAAPPPPGGELDLHIDVAFNGNASQWTAAHFDFERQAWLDVNWLTSELTA